MGKVKIDWSKVKDVIGAVAPTVGAALGGPFGVIAGKAIQEALGETDEIKVIEALQTDPNKVLELKKAEIAFKEFMRNAEITETQLAVDNQKSARSMAVHLGSIAPQFTIVVFLTIMLGWVIYELFVDAPPKGSENVLFILLGQLSTAWMAAISFFVGTTRSSGDKTQAIIQALGK